MDGAIYVSDSGNTKIMGSRKVDTTYAAIENSCPKSCPLKDNGCYAKTSYTALVNIRNEKSAEGMSALEVARAEAKAIDVAYQGKKFPVGRDLRLHTAGDSRTLKGTRLINNAIGRWKKRGGGECWSYTHAWKDIPRSEWSNVSMLASITSVTEVNEARKQGYSPAIVVAEHPSDKAFKLEGCDTKWIPCPAQTKYKINCVDCRLCMRSDFLFTNNIGIAFAAHGAKQNVLKRHLAIIK